MKHMAATAWYPAGTIRARRWRGQDDIRCCRPPRGWTASADLTDIHPMTGQTRAKRCMVDYRGENVATIEPVQAPKAWAEI